jgi:hypothetical protein
MAPLVGVSGAGCCFLQSALSLLERGHGLVARQQQLVKLRLHFRKLCILLLHLRE